MHAAVRFLRDRIARQEVSEMERKIERSGKR
jgi:hypothetical protein